MHTDVGWLSTWSAGGLFPQVLSASEMERRRMGRREGGSDMERSGGIGGCRRGQSLAGRDTVMENIEDNKVRRGGRMQTDALREKMGLMV